ncbi:MAG: Mut7-C RNAse domain-containing protein [Acidobacteriota bacterium]
MAPAAATFRFYAELNDHLPPARKFRPLRKEFLLPASVKDMIESFGVPHAEVDLVLVNGESSDFSRLIRDGDRVSVYPVFESLDITPALRLRPQPLREPKFVLDVHLGRLAAFLRMLGFDTLYDNQADDSALVRISSEENRVLLTRDRGVLRHSAVTRGYWLRATDSRRQAAEIVRRFDLAGSIQPFTRCMVCNHPLRRAAKEQVRDRVPQGAFELQEQFRECPGCGRVYWEGTHTQRMHRWIEQLIGAGSEVSDAGRRGGTGTQARSD